MELLRGDPTVDEAAGALAISSQSVRRAYNRAVNMG